MEAEYLKRTVSSSLAEGLAEVASKRPADPVEYLALWLLKHKVNLQTREQQGALYDVHSPPAKAPDQVEETSQTTAVSESPTSGEQQHTEDEAPQETPPKEEQPAQPDVPTISIEVEKSSGSKLSRIEEEPEESETTGDKDKNQQLEEKPSTEQSQTAEETDTSKVDLQGASDPPASSQPTEQDSTQPSVEENTTGE